MKHTIAILSVACTFFASQAVAQVATSSATQTTQPTAPAPREQNQLDTPRQAPLQRPGSEPNMRQELNQRCSLFSSRMDWWTFSMSVTYMNTISSYDCSPEELRKLTPASATAQLRSIPSFGKVAKGVSSHYLMDVNLSSVSDQFYTLGNLPFSTSAHISLPAREIFQMILGGNKAHMPRYVPFFATSNAHYIWNPGNTVHEIVLPNGQRFIMYAFTSEIDETLTRKNLSGLRKRLTLPAGFEFNSYLPNKLITVRASPANGYAVMLMFDELNNYYIEYSP